MTTSDRSVEVAFLAYRKSRSPQALAQVYDLTSSRLLAVALHISSSAVAAEDAVQDTFLFALEYPERWDESRPLVPWLLGILGNRLKQSVHRARRTPDPARLNLPDPADPGAELETNEILTHIERAITCLAQPYRAVVLLRLRNGLSPADIAIALDRKPSTVRAQLTRGVEMLRKLLPVGVTSLLVGSLLAGRGLAAVRTSVLERALTTERAFRIARQTELLRHVGLGLAGCAAVALTVWLAAAWFSGSAEVPGDPFAEIEAESEVVVHARQVESATRTGAAENARERVAATGSVIVRVTSAGRSIADAAVTLEPLGDSPYAFVHQTSGSPGQWSVTVAGRPVEESEHRHGRTADDGRCTLSGLRAGHWIVRAAGVDEVVEVVPAQTADLELRTAARIVRGTVLGRSGAPIAGASIWVCRAHVERLSREVARSDESGRFSIAVAPDAMVGARHKGLACVGVAVGGARAPSSQEVVLRLEELGAGITGRVLDDEGDPIPGATVQLGHPADTRAISRAPSPRVLARPVRATTDGAGRFRCDGLVTGVTWLTARAPGFGVTGQVAHLSPDSVADVTLTLSRAAVITGTLRTASGHPVAGASVRVGGGALTGRATTTGSDGSYRLTGVTPGRSLVIVTDYRGGFASREQQCGPGEVVIWDPEFHGGNLMLRGRVLGRTGQPFAGGWVAHLTPLGGTAYRLDDQGRFAVTVHERIAALPSSIRVYDHDPRGQGGLVFGAPLATAHDLRTGTSGIEIRLPVHTESPAWIEGRFDDETGVLATADVFLAAQVDGHLGRIRLDPFGSGGGFRAGPVPPGRYSISVVSAMRRRFGPFTIAAGQQCDLGVLRISSDAGAVTSDSKWFVRYLAFVWPGDVASSEDVYVEIRDAERRLFVTKNARRSAGGMSYTYSRLPAGRFVATATTASGLVAVREFEVDAVPQRRALLMPLMPK